MEAIEEIEVRTGIGFPKLARALSREDEVRFGHLLIMYEELCRGGGRPLSPEERADLLPSDLPEMLDAIRKAAIAVGIVEQTDEDEEEGDGEAGKKKGETHSPGDTGTE